MTNMRASTEPARFSFCFVLSYWRVAYLDYGSALFDRSPAAVRAMAARLQAFLYPPPRPIP
jgi:hypothetical protein